MQYIISKEAVERLRELAENIEAPALKQEADELLSDLRVRAEIPDPHPAEVWKGGIWLIKRDHKGNHADRLMGEYEWKTNDRNELVKVLDIIREHEGHQHYSSGTSISQRFESIVRNYQRTAANGLASAKSARDNMLTWLRAMSIIADMAGNAGTHGEKNARLRGMVEVIETAIDRLQNMQFDFSKSYWNWEDIFRSDYPVRHFMRRAHEAEFKIAGLEREIARLKSNGQSEAPSEDESEEEFPL